MTDGKTVWVQNCDYSLSIDEAVQSELQVLDLFDHFDWASELKIMLEMEERHEDWCPPGMGIIDPKADRILHLCPEADGGVTIHVMPPDRTRQESYSDISKDTSRAAIRAFLSQDFDQVSSLIKSDKK